MLSNILTALRYFYICLSAEQACGLFLSYARRFHVYRPNDSKESVYSVAALRAECMYIRNDSILTVTT